MADALVSVVVEQLASFLLEHHKEEVGLVAGACGEIKKLATTFEKIHAILYDAENQQVKNKSVKIWLGELKDVAYEIEDLLEEWHTRILKSQIDGDDDNAGSSSSKKKVSSYFLSHCSCFNKLSLHRDIGRKMKELRERLDVIATEKDKYDFNSVTITEDPNVRPDTISMINKSDIYGRGLDKKTIVSKLLSESSEEQMGVPVISIVGMGGLGCKFPFKIVTHQEPYLLQSSEHSVFTTFNTSTGLITTEGTRNFEYSGIQFLDVYTRRRIAAYYLT